MRWLRRRRDGDGDGPGRDADASAPDESAGPAAGSVPEPVPEKAGDDDATEPERETASPPEPAVSAQSGDLGGNLASVKKEYDRAVGDLIGVKKELAAKRRESAAANAACEELQRRANALEAQIRDAEILEGKARQSARERERAVEELARARTALDEQQKQLDSVRAQIGSAGAELDAVRQKTKDARAKLDEYGELLQKTRSMIKESNKQRAEGRERGGDVIRTASSMVASMGDKLAAAEKEIGVLRGLLEQERRAHAQSRARLSGNSGAPGG